ncbi:MAG: hypothetical protein CL902_10280 [Dehalococcoidia bacterium]|nr:hypothetical protein [Dehalococcoidia bacterium]
MDRKMTGGGRVDTGDVEPAKGNAKPKAILTTHGFELFINDAEEFSGNLQFNDHRNGDVFHATSIDQILFTNDPSLDSGNPGSSFNTARVSGAGRLNGVDGVRFTAVITDNGEPGKTDTFEITFPDGENPGISGVLEGGNHQAH